MFPCLESSTKNKDIIICRGNDHINHSQQGHLYLKYNWLSLFPKDKKWSFSLEDKEWSPTSFNKIDKMIKLSKFTICLRLMWSSTKHKKPFLSNQRTFCLIKELTTDTSFTKTYCIMTPTYNILNSDTMIVVLVQVLKGYKSIQVIDG